MKDYIKKLLYKENKSRADYLILVGYYAGRQSNPQDFEILTKLGENLRERYGVNMYNLSIFKNI